MKRLLPGVDLHLLHIPACRSNTHARETTLLLDNTDNDWTTGGDL